MYYTKDGVGRELNWNIDPSLSTKVISYTHDYAGSEIEPFIEDPALGDSLLFLQGYSGVNAKVTLNDLSNLQDVIINRAELEVFGTILDEDKEFYPLPEQLIAAEIVDEELSLVRDFSFSTSVGNVSLSGGDKEDFEENIYQYKLNLSTHFQEIVDGDASNEIILRLFPKPSNVRRMAIFGPGHSTYPMKLVITYTQL